MLHARPPTHSGERPAGAGWGDAHAAGGGAAVPVACADGVRGGRAIAPSRLFFLETWRAVCEPCAVLVAQPAAFDLVRSSSALYRLALDLVRFRLLRRWSRPPPVFGGGRLGCGSPSMTESGIGADALLSRNGKGWGWLYPILGMIGQGVDILQKLPLDRLYALVVIYRYDNYKDCPENGFPLSRQLSTENRG